ncbi:MAG: Glycogen/starch/alpha-glucan phosphorylase [Candidatus Woesebacteria bacterium GW2011_GWA1_37_7]|uniref:Glycogen/starch/alpha-glucan phosphorylase n=1 Tax=Candidatus Woesebacteria bacterium GW2011_GWA1_37_7 TaxID=1618545 RepID=A0A0G0JK83_9BACT|nr:MAG: Glycogen/starch/alpha-glucan phosphorylase [Candidatus Woesebacteria bacterium GW2011_GWA1_37_7]
MRLNEIKEPVAFFCNEFALDNDLPTYSGGLGILAGDIVNSAATTHFPMVGIGILYKGKEFNQHITGEGREEKRDSEFDHDTSFLRTTTVDGKPLVLTLDIKNQKVQFKSYHIRLSDTTIVFLLSTDVDGNPPEWITDMDALYHGDTNSLIRQQILLGIGGLKLLNALDISPRIYHINEGRPCLLIWQLVENLIEKEKMNFSQAWKAAIKKIVYTNHTLVAAGNLTYPSATIAWWAESFADKLNVDTNELIKDGLTDPQTFSITQFALNISNKHSSVSKVHSQYCEREWQQYDWIAITNGVNMDRWQDSDFRSGNLSEQGIWDLHLTKKRELMTTVIKRTGFGYDPDKLIVAWSRRLAEYKQPKAIFKDIERLKTILTNKDRPIQLLFAGNSHSADPNAKSIIEEIIDLFTDELSGSAIFVPNYNISLANHLTSGVDLWLNTPKGNLEACGTSGMKAISNGVLNCTVLDGWTYEVDWNDTGWIVDPNNVAESFYYLLEHEISPLYYERNADGYPSKWIQRMKRSIAISKYFSSERVLEDYKNFLYK